jgi:hypothetical protein
MIEGGKRFLPKDELPPQQAFERVFEELGQLVGMGSA